MIDLEWHDFLDLGIDFIDTDHRNLLKVMQAIKLAIEENNRNKCVQLLNTLLQDAKDHFSREEEFLLAAKYPELEEHKLYHKELLIKADTTKRICEGIETERDLKECFDNMANFLIDDILKGDIKFKSYLEYEGYIKD